MTSDTLPLTLTTKPLVCMNCLKKTVYHSSYFATCNKFFSIQDCRTWIFQVEYQGQTEFLNTNLWSLHLIAFNIDWSWNTFTLHNFCSMLIKQLIYLEKVRTDNLKFGTDLRDQVMDGWSVTQQMHVCKGRLLKKSSNQKLKLILSTLITTWLSSITFHLQSIWLQTLVVIKSESSLT